MGAFETIPVGDTSARLYAAGADNAGSSAVLLLHPWWGLNDDVIALAERLARAGFHVAAPDMFGGEVATTIEGAEGLASTADEQAINPIVLAALDRLSEGLDPSARIAALGFSFGAHWAIWSPTQRDCVVASVLYYGTTGDNLTDSSTPVLGHFAEDDPFESPEWVARFESILRSAHPDVEFHRYPGTGHWFAEPSRDAYRPEAADLAFERTVVFLRKHLGAGAPVG